MNIKTILAAAIVLAATSLQATAGDYLNSDELRRLAPGKYNVSVLGLVSMTVSMQPGGNIMGTTSKKKSDQGRWSVQGERFCITWNRWLKGRTRCVALSGDNGTYSGGGLYIRKI